MRARFEFLRGWKRQRGLALISVLWALSILSLIAAAMVSSSTLSYRAERNLLRHVEAEMLAEAAINRALLGITDTRAQMRWRAGGPPQDVSFRDARASVWIEDESGKIDLNATNRDLLEGLFKSAGIESAEADALADRVVEWRTPADAEHFQNASRFDYRAAGHGYRPRNGPFQSIDELKLVLGVTPQLFRRIAPALTVYSKRDKIDESFAPKEALLALPGMDEQKATEIIAERMSDVSQDEESSTSAPPLNGRVFTVTAQVADAKRRVVQAATVLITGDTTRPYLVLAWR